MLRSLIMCAHCNEEILDQTTMVTHGDLSYCCPNCAAAMEESGSFWVPMPDSSPRVQRSRAEATAQLAAQGEDESARAGGPLGAGAMDGSGSPGASSNGSARKPGQTSSTAWNLPEMRDGELEGSV